MIVTSDLSDEIKQHIKTAIPDADVEVKLASDRHYEISVTSASFKSLTQVKRHQKVYGAISDFMLGDNAPIHAIDRMDTKVKI